MKKRIKYILIIIVILAGVYAGYHGLSERKVPMDDFIAVENGIEGEVLAAWYEDDETVIARINSNGKIEKYYAFRCEFPYKLRGMAT